MTRSACSSLFAATALLGALASACSSAGSTERPEAPRDLLIRAKEFSYSAPDTVAEGIVSVRLVNEGSEMHHVQLVRIGEGHTFEELRASAAAGNPFPPWVTPVGGPNESSLGTDVRVALDLPAGQSGWAAHLAGGERGWPTPRSAHRPARSRQDGG